MIQRLVTEKVEVQSFEGAPPVLMSRAERDKCAHCGGLHARACPRVASIEYWESGSIKRVRFWKTFDDDGVIWPEDLFGSDDDDE